MAIQVKGGDDRSASSQKELPQAVRTQLAVLAVARDVGNAVLTFCIMVRWSSFTRFTLAGSGLRQRRVGWGWWPRVWVLLTHHLHHGAWLTRSWRPRTTHMRCQAPPSPLYLLLQTCAM